MKPKLHCILIVSLLFATFGIPLYSAFAQGTAFTYQGRLNAGGNLASGSYDLTFTLFNTNTSGVPIAGTITNSATAVSNGLFTTTIDFGAGVFTGSSSWLEIAVRTNGAGGFGTLTPRQEVTPTPNAIYAESANAAGLIGNIPTASLSGTYSDAVTLNNAANSFAGNGASVSNVNAATLGGLAATNFWKTTGNAGTTANMNFLGTTDNQPLELHVNGIRVFRIEPGSTAANVIGGSGNTVPTTTSGATIGGGTLNTNLNYCATIGGGTQNAAAGPGSFIGGGGYDGSIYSGNLIFGPAGAATVGGGIGNGAYSKWVTVGGGAFNINNGVAGTIAGGLSNSIISTADYSTVGGGEFNTVYGVAGTIAGGLNNNVNHANYATVGGGSFNTASGVGSFVGGGGTEGTTFSSFLGNSASGTASTIGGGLQNNASGPSSFIGGGGFDGANPSGNSASGIATTIGGGMGNVASGPYSAVLGGQLNQATNYYASVAGGDNNIAGAEDAAVGGGAGNRATGVGSFVGGGGFDGTFYLGNTASGTASTVAGGLNNLASGNYATVPGGSGNTAHGQYSFAAGEGVSANDNNSFIWGDGTRAGVSQGADTFTVLATGGAFFYTTTSGVNVEVDPTGDLDFGTTTRQMLNLYSSAYGIGVQNDDMYFRCDNSVTGTGFAWYRGGTTNNNPFNNGGGTTLMTLTASGLTVNGTFVSASDRNLKENFSAVDSRVVLEKVSALPIQNWNYKADAASRHIGPMAQDFYGAFGVGPDDKHIAVVDEGGVALAAIQGLNQKVEELKTELKHRDMENAELEQRLEKLEQLMPEKVGGVK